MFVCHVIINEKLKLIHVKSTSTSAAGTTGFISYCQGRSRHVRFG